MKKLQHFATLAALCCALTSMPLLAEVNFGGHWKMNPSRSNFGSIPPPATMQRTITHEGRSIAMQSVQMTPRGEMKSEYKFTTDGKEFTQQSRTGEVKGTARWQGDMLVVETRRTIQGATITSTDRWTLSEDGKGMVVEVTLTTPQGATQMSIAFDKQ